ncbi:Long-chain-fatty-acid-CoA ligase [Hartmannibacter diazotrophicus]|uniref:Long-chain-fatty-acid-CoA ligase n=1 Tax=Hartmannibacter diazotrophicus TaxID=1482074 RepID=A0A2C9D346_9HYPH|nr:class I adenylate-forming enzyme family protein [Hartmannibacter diazotrophicus]SON53895.1 Long-chain-fatty-acid-CoA ligase [Hartmannibacter diazotrophicus]
MSSAVKNLGMIGSEFRNDARPAVIDLWDPENPRTVDYSTFHASCDAVARGLVERGFKPGDRVGILCSNRVEFLEVFYGSMRAGVVPVMIGILLPADTVSWIVDDANVKLVFCETTLHDKLPTTIEATLIGADGENGFEAFKRPGPFEPFVPHGDDVAFLPYTSGSTGRPKGVVLSHRAHSWVAETISKDRDFAPSDRMIVAAPLYHKHAMNSIKCVLVGGSTVVLMRKFDARAYIDAVNRYRTTVVSGVPTIFAMMLQQRDLLTGHDYSFVRLATMGGAPATDTLIDAVADLFPKADIVTIFGITEASAALFGRHPERKPRPRHSIGWPIAGNDFRLVGGEDENFGTLHIRGPGLMNEYNNNPAETEKRLRNGWFDSGDILRRDEEGWYYFVGRGDDMFVSSGHNIYPGEVEVMLERHPDIEQALVVAAPDEIKYRIPYAFIVKRKGATLTEQDVKDHALKNAPPYQYPRKVIFLPAMPMNGVGKIDRKLLTAQAVDMVEEAQKGATV